MGQRVDENREVARFEKQGAELVHSEKRKFASFAHVEAATSKMGGGSKPYTK